MQDCCIYSFALSHRSIGTNHKQQMQSAMSKMTILCKCLSSCISGRWQYHHFVVGIPIIISQVTLYTSQPTCKHQPAVHNHAARLCSRSPVSQVGFSQKMEPFISPLHHFTLLETCLTCGGVKQTSTIPDDAHEAGVGNSWRQGWAFKRLWWLETLRIKQQKLIYTPVPGNQQ